MSDIYIVYRQCGYDKGYRVAVSLEDAEIIRQEEVEDAKDIHGKLGELQVVFIAKVVDGSIFTIVERR